MSDVGSVGHHVLCIATIDRVSGHLLAETQGLPSRGAVPTGIPQPRNGHPIPFSDMADPGADLLNDAHTFVARDEGRVGLDRPIAVGCVDIGVAETTRLDLHDDLPKARLRFRYVFDLQWLIERVNNCCSHDVLLGSVVNWVSADGS
jgi:hypothetical protein